jgi:hypothetical protein
MAMSLMGKSQSSFRQENRKWKVEYGDGDSPSPGAEV